MRAGRLGAAGWIAAVVALWLSLAAAPAAAAMSAERLVDPLGDMAICSVMGAAGHAPGHRDHDACPLCAACCAAPAALCAPEAPRLSAPAVATLDPAPPIPWSAPRGPPARRARARDPPPVLS